MKKLVACLLFMCAIGLFSFNIGCGDGGEARVRVVHASPDAPNINVEVDGSSKFEDLAYRSFSDYKTVDSGERRIVVIPTSGGNSVISQDVSFSGDTHDTLFVVDRLATISLLPVRDDDKTPPSDQVKLRAIHGAPSAPTVDVYLTAPGVDLSTVSPVISNLAFKGVSGYLTVISGTYQIRVTPTGTKTVVLDTGSVDLQSERIQTIVVVDAPGGGTPFSALLLRDSD